MEVKKKGSREERESRRKEVEKKRRRGGREEKGRRGGQEETGVKSPRRNGVQEKRDAGTKGVEKRFYFFEKFRKKKKNFPFAIPSSLTDGHQRSSWT